jgi:hypothetical protein
MPAFGPNAEFANADSPLDGLVAPRLYEATEDMVLADGRMIAAGTTFYFSGEPGVALAPAAQSAVGPKVAAVEAWLEATVPIWGRHIETLRLARSLGFEGGTVAQAAAFIEAWLDDPAVVSDIADAPSLTLETSYQGTPGYQDPQEKWPDLR